MRIKTSRESVDGIRQVDNNGGLRVVVLAKGFPPTSGGVEQYSLQIVRAYLRAGLSVTVLTQTEGSRGWSQVASVDGTFTLWNAGPGPQALVFLLMLRESLRLKRRVPVRSVHSTTWRVALVTLFAFRNRAKVLSVHGREIINYPPGLGPWLRRILAHSDVVISVSKATQILALGVVNQAAVRGKWSVGYNGLTYADHITRGKRIPDAGAPIRLLSLSRLVPRKNIEASLRALSTAAISGHRNLEFKIAGTGPDRSRLELLARELGLEDNVTFLGYVRDENVPSLYEWADIFLHPHTHSGQGNDFEGFGIVIADAMMFGCAVVVGNIGGPRELIEHGVNGLLVDGERVEDVAETLVRLIESPELVRALGAEAQRTARLRFSWDNHIRPAIDLFEGREAV
jgi:glycosyltransferase involved in cell wall biosynthesis